MLNSIIALQEKIILHQKKLYCPHKQLHRPWLYTVMLVPALTDVESVILPSKKQLYNIALMKKSYCPCLYSVIMCFIAPDKTVTLLYSVILCTCTALM